MSSRVRAPISTKHAGLLLALAFALIAAGVVLFFVMRHKGAGGPAVVAAPELKAPPPPGTGGGARDPMGEMGATQYAHVQFVDRKKPGRIAGEMLWLSLEPLEQRGRSLITEPLFWLYPDAARTVRIQGRQARIFQPDQQSEPESGRLEGGVPITIYSGRPKGAGTESKVEQPPELLFHSQDLNFDSVIGEVSTGSDWTASTADMDFAGRGLRVQVNELRSRLELLEVDRGGSIRYSRAARPERPAAAPAPVSKPAAPANPARAASPSTDDAGAPAEPAPQREEMYRAVFSGNVKVVQRGRVIEGDALEVWVRMLDGSLPADAIGGADGRAEAPAEPRPAAATVASVSLATHVLSAAVAALAQPEEQPAAGATTAGSRTTGEDDVTLTWTGTLVIRPLENAPRELSGGNHVALRFTADQSGSVRFADAAAGLSGRCAWAEYLATTQDLTLSGPGPTAVVLTTKDAQRALVGRVELNLASGVGAVPGPGVLEDGRRRVTWTERADMVFATKDGQIVGELREAAFAGQVIATNGETGDREARLRGEFVRALFVAAEGQPTALSRLRVEGGAAAEAGGDALLRAETLDVAFRPGKGDPNPSVLTAVGQVLAKRGLRQLNSEFLEAALERNDAGQTIATDVFARDNVRISGEDGLVAAADELRADVPTERAQLTGREAMAGRSGARIYGANIGLDGLNGLIVSEGAGRFEHAPPAGARSGAARRMTASWTESMRFDNAKGEVLCFGDVKATASDAPGLEVSIAEGQHLRILLTPGRAAPSLAGATPTAASDDRALLLAEISGPDENDAMVESRRYIADATAEGGRRLERFIRLTGARIIADETQGTLSVPGPGRAAVFDGRSSPEDRTDRAEAPADLLQGRGFRGAALFTWRGSMSMERISGLVRMRQSVQLVHRPLGDDPPASLECERLDAQLRSRSGPGIALQDGEAAELVWAQARDAVYFQSGTRKLVGDEVNYDAVARTAVATAAEGNRVTLFDEARATPVSARKLTWDLRRDAITVEQPTPIVTPVTRQPR